MGEHDYAGTQWPVKRDSMCAEAGPQRTLVIIEQDGEAEYAIDWIFWQPRKEL